ncbi:MAG: hypothetical protein DDT19_02879 [Syntrophomonadaceae bacterium]|nr:hypothetical protein [Bacillota bacterium]
MLVVVIVVPVKILLVGRTVIMTKNKTSYVLAITTYGGKEEKQW